MVAKRGNIDPSGGGGVLKRSQRKKGEQGQESFCARLHKGTLI